VDTAEVRAFHPGLPETGQFPFDLWARLLARAWRRPQAALLTARAPAGLPALRRAIAGHLSSMRGIDCTAEQVVVTSSAREAVALVARSLLEPGDEVWIEDPGYPAVRHALAAGGLMPRGLAVDAEGLSLEAGLAQAPAARMAVVTPSRQYPLGITMTLGRRLALLDWARTAGAWIVEDDYDSEYRYAGRPLAALQSLDEAGRTIYLGSFSKVMFHKLRLGYLVLPPGLAEPLLSVREDSGAEPSIAAQPALAAFIDGGQFAQHIRRMRRLYAERQEALLRAIARHAGDLLAAERQEGGMHLVASLEPALAARMDDRAAEARAAEAGLVAAALSAFYRETPPRQGLLLGYAGAGPAELDRAMARLARALRL
jgi:GntR family transcriptional regulator/MocR family aminotransferase